MEERKLNFVAGGAGHHGHHDAAHQPMRIGEDSPGDYRIDMKGHDLNKMN